MDKTRCSWVGEDPIMIDYHDHEWGRPIYDAQKLFEFLCLEGAQAGLSWMTILKRRPGYRKAFYHFDITKVAAMNNHTIEALRNDQGIIRNHLKIKSVINNAQCWLKLSKTMSVVGCLWQFVHGTPMVNHFQQTSDVPSATEVSAAMSKWLKQQGFSFVGSTICYAFMQATGMVNDHIASCYLYKNKPKNITI